MQRKFGNERRIIKGLKVSHSRQVWKPGTVYFREEMQKRTHDKVNRDKEDDERHLSSPSL